MRSRSRRIDDVLVSGGGLALLLAALVAFDDRVRYQASLLFSSGKASPEFASMGDRIRDMVLVLAQAARDQSIDHAPLVIFTVIATVLVLFMLRT